MPPSNQSAAVNGLPLDLRSSRSGWLLVGGTVIAWGFLLFGFNDAYPWLSLVEVLTTLFGLALVVVSLWHRDDRMPRGLGLGALAVTSLLFFIWCWIQIRVAPAYGTDEAAFDQYAAQLFHQGIDPYTRSMAPAFPLFHVSPDGYTFTMAGTPVTALSYPALSFLLYVPLLMLGLSSQVAIVTNVVAWALAVAVAYFLLPRDVKPLAIVLGSFAIYTGFAVGGVTDALYVPFLLVAVYRWDQWLARRGWLRWLSPTMLGLAMSVKQTPWFILPFLLVGLYLEARQSGDDRRTGLRQSGDYLLRTGLVFLLVNAYSITQNPVAWVRGIATPFFDHLVPAGEGWVALSDFLGRGGGSLQLFTVLFVVVAIACLVLFAFSFPRSKSLLVFFPSIILFFAARSYTNYLVMLLLPALVAFCSVRPTDPDVPRLRVLLWGDRRRRLFLGGLVALVPIALVVVTFYPQPLRLHIDAVDTTGQLATVIDVQMTVTNATATTVTPVFASESGGALSAPWNILHGPSRLGAHATASYDVQAPNFFAQPSLSGGFQMVALTTSPEAMSVSAPFTPTHWHVNLNPEAVNRPVPVGAIVTITAQVLDATDNPVLDAGIPVYLGQVSYTQHGLVFTQAVINNSAEGATPVEAATNSDGVATFRVTNAAPSLDPVYFEANLINGSSSYPYGYSNIIPIRFR